MPTRSPRPHPATFPWRLAAQATLALLVAACAGLPSPASHPAFVVLRHAEKLDDGTRDPGLSAEGRARAGVVAGRLRHVPLEGAWASQYLRTLQTAEPAVRARAVPVVRYDAGESPQSLAARLRAAHTGGTVLVVGHSNTVPGLVAALCACEVAPLDESQYDRWFELHPGADGGLVLREARF
jgi:broad specificity phosphatase PhoE